MHNNTFVKVDGKRNPYRREQVENGIGLRFSVITTEDRVGMDWSLDVTFAPYQKTALTFAAPIPHRFFVDTIEGPQQEGQPGDYLAVGQSGEMYPIARDIFEETYEGVDERKDWYLRS